MTEQLDQKTINSLFDNIIVSDKNAHLVLSILHEDGHNIDNLLQKIATDIPEYPKPATNPVNIYMHSVFHNAEQTRDFLIENSETPTSYSLQEHDGRYIMPYHSNDSHSPIMFTQANDITIAILSDNQDTLHSLLKTKSDDAIETAINHETATPASLMNLSNTEAKQLSPLDVAVIKYVAISVNNKENSRMQKDIALEIIDKQKETFSQEFKIAQLAGANMCMTLPIPEKNVDILHIVKTNEEDIFTLLEHGAQSSTNSYFPTSDESTLTPFMCDDFFEVMSLQEFCEANSDVFSPQLLKALTHVPSAPKVDPDIGAPYP